MGTKGLTLLSIDWDFYFPEPVGRGEGDALGLYDWGHSEKHLGQMQDAIWMMRACSFAARELPLPMVNKEWQTFWGRFDFSNCREAYITDSHKWAAASMISNRFPGEWEEVVSFDAHHDLGYETPMTYQGAVCEVTCENWLEYYTDVRGAKATVVYPDWKTRAFDLEPSYQAKSPLIRRVFDKDFDRVIAPDIVFIARSGAWVPTWCDDDFITFTEQCPVGQKINLLGSDGAVTRRYYDQGEVNKIREELRKVMGNVG